MTQHEYRVILETNYLNRKPTRVEFLLQGRTIDFKETLSWKIYREITNYFPKNIQTLIDKTTLLTSSEGLDFVLNIEPNTLIIRFPVTNPSDSLPELVLLLKENKQKPQFIVDLTIMEQIRIYDTHAQYETELSTLIKPNVSFCVDLSHIHFNPIDPFNGHEYIDLGLPSGTLWATMNVGASSPTDYGKYFAWGETVGYANVSTKSFSWNDYKYGAYDSSDSTNYGMTKYNNTDGISNLEPTDDAASVNMGGDWHMPTQQQCRELFEQTKNGFVTSAGTFTLYAWVSGDNYSEPTQTTATINNWNTAGYFFFKSNVTNYNTAISSGEYLFIPAAGGCEDGNVHDVGKYGLVWASSLSENVNLARNFNFDSDEAGLSNNFRFIGQSVRGVVGYPIADVTP